MSNEVRHCPVCGMPMAKRRGAKWCSPPCRAEGSRLAAADRAASAFWVQIAAIRRRARKTQPGLPQAHTSRHGDQGFIL